MIFLLEPLQKAFQLLLHLLHPAGILRFQGFQPLLLPFAANPVFLHGDLLTFQGAQLSLEGVDLLFQLFGVLALLLGTLGEGFGLLLQLGDFPGTGKQPCTAAFAAAGEGTPGVDHLAVQGDDFKAVAKLPAHGGGAVQVLRHHNPAQQGIHNPLVLGIRLHQMAGQIHIPFLVRQVIAGELPALHRSQGQKGGPAGVLLFQKPNGAFGGVFVFHHNVLHTAAQSGFNGQGVFFRHLKQPCHRAVDALQPPVFGLLHHRFHRVGKAFQVVFQIPKQLGLLPQLSCLPQ